MKNLKEINLQEVVKTIPIMQAYKSEEYVSCSGAKVLPYECYGWCDPDILCACFDTGNEILVAQKYASLSLGMSKIDLRGGTFVSCLNQYLDRLDISDEAMLKLLKEDIYPFLDHNYEDILLEYRKAGRQNDLKSLRIFAFEMADHTFVFEDASKKNIWMSNVPDGFLSFGKYRCIK